MIGTRQLLTIGMLAALAVVAASAVTFGAAFAQDNNQDQECTEPNCRIDQQNDQGNNEVGAIECTEPNCRIDQQNDQGNNEVGGMTFN